MLLEDDIYICNECNSDMLYLHVEVVINLNEREIITDVDVWIDDAFDICRAYCRKCKKEVEIVRQ